MMQQFDYFFFRNTFFNINAISHIEIRDEIAFSSKRVSLLIFFVQIDENHNNEYEMYNNITDEERTKLNQTFEEMNLFKLTYSHGDNFYEMFANVKNAMYVEIIGNRVCFTMHRTKNRRTVVAGEINTGVFEFYKRINTAILHRDGSSESVASLEDLFLKI